MSLVAAFGKWVHEKEAKRPPAKITGRTVLETKGRWARRDGNITPPADRTKPAKGEAHERRQGRKPWPSHAGTHGERNAARKKDVTAHAPWDIRSDEPQDDGVDRKPWLVKRKPARVMGRERQRSPGRGSGRIRPKHRSGRIVRGPASPDWRRNDDKLERLTVP